MPILFGLEVRKMTERFLRRFDVSTITGLPVSTIYEMMSRGTFPKNIRISPRLVAWRETDIAEWQQARIAERDGSAQAA
jgi:prophage regulatory protein